MSPITTKLTDKLTLVTLLDSEMPQTHAIEQLTFPADTEEIIVDNVVRSRLTDQRFTDFVVNDGQADLTTKNYVEPTDNIKAQANNILKQHLTELTNSILTQREIDKLTK